MTNQLTSITKEISYKDSAWVSANPYEIELFNDPLNRGYLVRTINPNGEIKSNIRTKNESYAWEIMYRIQSRYSGYKTANLELLEYSRRGK